MVIAFRCSSSSDSRILSRIGIIDLREILQVHPNTLRVWDEKGYLVAIRFGTRRDRRYRREDVMKLLEKNNGRKKQVN